MFNFADKSRGGFLSGAPKRFVALALNDRRLRVVSAEARDDLPRFRKPVAVDAPDELDWNDAEAVGHFVGAALRRMGLHGPKVLMDVPRSQAVLKTLTLPPVDDPRDLPAMVRYQVEKELPYPIDQAVVDFTIERHISTSAENGNGNGNGNGNDKSDADNSEPHGTDVLVAAVKTSVIEHYEKIAAAANIKLHRLGLRPWADTRCLHACLPREQGSGSIALVHVLGDETEIDVMIDGTLAFSRSAAVKLPRNAEAEPATAAQATQALVVEVVRSLQSVQAAQRGTTIDALWIAGDTGIESSLSDALHQRLSRPCGIVEPVEALHIRRAKVEGRGFVTPIGLAIAHGTASPITFDFLHPKKPPVQRNIRKIRAVTAATAAAVLLIAGVVSGMVYRGNAEARFDHLQSEKNRLTNENKPITKLAKRVSAVEEWVGRSHNWLDHWANLSALFPSATDAYITTLKSNPDGSFTFTVKARSSDVITALVNRLMNAGYDVKPGAETSNGDEKYPYSTTRRLVFDSEMTIDTASLKAVPRPNDDGSAEMIGRRRSSPFRRTSSPSRGPTSNGPAGPTNNNSGDKGKSNSNGNGNGKSNSTKSGNSRDNNSQTNKSGDNRSSPQTSGNRDNRGSSNNSSRTPSNDRNRDSRYRSRR